MTTAVLPADIVVNGKLLVDLRSLSTPNLNSALTSHSTTENVNVFYAQWALKNAGWYAGPINGIVGSTNDLINAFINLYNQNYSGSSTITGPPGSGGVSTSFFRAVINDYSDVDINVYKVTA